MNLRLMLIASLMALAGVSVGVSATEEKLKLAPVVVTPGNEIKLPFKFSIDGEPVAQILRVVFGEIVKGSYAFDPAVVADNRRVSFRWDSEKGEIRPFLIGFLDMLGYDLVQRDGVDYIRQRDGKAKEVEVEKDAFIYKPKYRDGSYLVDLLSPIFKGGFTAKRMVQAPLDAKSPQQAVPPGSAAASIDRRSDLMVFSGTEKEIARLKKLLEQVDVPSGEVLVRGALYEVQTGNAEGSAFQIASSILSGKLGFNIATGATSLANSITLKQGGGLTIDAALSALSSDSRFKSISSPSLRVRSGTPAKLTVGDDVPILGALSYPQGSGQAVQSVEYRSSGVIFDITPDVRDSAVDLKIDQQISAFIQTNTGVNGSPTLSKREFTTNVSVADGDLVVLGGLNQSKETTSHSGFSFLPAFMKSKSDENSKSEILLVLQVSKI